jgi:insecticidal toxin complex protein TccC
MSVHSKTPTLSVSDPRGLSIRTVGYWRSQPNGPARTCVSRTNHDVAGRAVAQWDPRLWALQVNDPQAPANLISVYLLNGQVLRLDSVDAGMQITLPGVGAQALFEWDSRGTRREVHYDPLLRPVAVFEEGASQPPRCIERLAYGQPGAGDPTRNQLGQLIRHDDPAGSVLFDAFAISGQCTENSRHFTQDLAIPDWPEEIDQRTRLLEPGEGATTRWRFGPLHQIIEQIDARGNRHGSEWTLDGRLRASYLQLKHQSEARMPVTDVHYNADGLVTQEVAGNGVRTTLTYRPTDGVLQERQAKKNDGEVLQHLIYDYDPMGNVSSIEDKAMPVRYFANQRIEPVSRFTYDSFYQLIEATGWEAGVASQGPASVGRFDPAAFSNYRQTYRYDAGGNLLELTHVGAQTHGRQFKTALYSNRGLGWRNGTPPTEEQIAGAFDSRGNLLELGQGQFVRWNLRNQAQLVCPVERLDERDDEEVYRYDAGGQRVRKIRSLQTNARSVFNEVRYLPGLEMRTDSGSGEVLQVITVQGELNSLNALHWETSPPPGGNDRYCYIITDHLGSASLELAEDARIISQATYYPSGETAWSRETEVSYRTVRYSGKEQDATGLYYYGYRYYIPWLQRWMNPDPAGTIDGLNLYRMVHNNPLSLTDPNGLKPTRVEAVAPNHNGAASVPLSSRPPVPPRPATGAVARPAPAVPAIPKRPNPGSPVVGGGSASLPPRKPPIDLGIPAKLTGPLPFYASSTKNVGSHALLLDSTGAIVAMRADNRTPAKIREAGGFYPRDNRGVATIKQEFRQNLGTKKLNDLATEHVRYPVPGYVSTGMDEASGGYGDTRDYLYRMAIPGLEEREINAQTLELDSPFKFTPRGRNDARLLMSGDTLGQSQFALMIPPLTEEMTFITPIPNQYIVAFKALGSDKWVPF